MNFIEYLIEAKIARGRQTWLDVLEDDTKISQRTWSRDPEQSRHHNSKLDKMVEWARANKKTLNHMYHALRSNYQEITDNEVEPTASVEQKLDHWMGRMDYRDLPIYNELAKRHDRDDVSHVARIMIDTLVDEVQREA